MSKILIHMRKSLKEAMFAKAELTKSILRLVLGEAGNLENRKGQKGPVTDGQVVKIIGKIISGNEELMGYQECGPLQAQKMIREIKILSSFLPKTMSEDEIRQVLQGTLDDIRDAKADGPAVGLAMGILKKSGSLVDGSQVTAIVKEIRGQTIES